ncbi:hypothetical protein COV18_07440 [Candidatus Woesearchaeota archaeon CG10_big_fil_rev_8_21_14_0_10_37_12]|nr:MAG: hypothetical protein COV18_07440 [Candidatus Woesearchaeota archaeon CG10_big_fil_rev_8_21_14_0_10_37_12]
MTDVFDEAISKRLADRFYQINIEGKVRKPEDILLLARHEVGEGAHDGVAYHGLVLRVSERGVFVYDLIGNRVIHKGDLGKIITGTQIFNRSNFETRSDGVRLSTVDFADTSKEHFPPRRVLRNGRVKVGDGEQWLTERIAAYTPSSGNSEYNGNTPGGIALPLVGRWDALSARERNGFADAILGHVEKAFGEDPSLRVRYVGK